MLISARYSLYRQPVQLLVCPLHAKQLPCPIARSLLNEVFDGSSAHRLDYCSVVARAARGPDTSSNGQLGDVVDWVDHASVIQASIAIVAAQHLDTNDQP